MPTYNSRSVNPQRTKEGKEIKIQKYYNQDSRDDHDESLLSGDVGDLKSILSSTKSPNPKNNSQYSSRHKAKSRDMYSKRVRDKRKLNNDSPFLRISDLGNSQSLMMGDTDILFQMRSFNRNTGDGKRYKKAYRGKQLRMGPINHNNILIDRNSQGDSRSSSIEKVYNR